MLKRLCQKVQNYSMLFTQNAPSSLLKIVSCLLLKNVQRYLQRFLIKKLRHVHDSF